MTREECEAKLAELATEAYALVKQFDPDVLRMNIFGCENGFHLTAMKPGEKQWEYVVDWCIYR